jgi:type II restriction/modification system DNA methylase subunit YeeA
MSDFVRQHQTTCNFKGNESWVILSPIEQSIKDKIESVGTPLKDWDINIYRGVLTGCNEAFIISTEKRNEILNNCTTEEERRRTEELIRPILRGRDIKRYGYNWANLWLINTHNGVKGKYPPIDINDYPAIKQHLDLYWDKISKRDDKGVTPYNLRNCAYLEDFKKPKIIYPETTQGAYFAYDDNGVFLDKTCFMLISGDAEYLQFTLSSKLFEYAYKRIFSSVSLGEHGYQYNKHALVKLPVVKPTDSITKRIKTSDIESFIFDIYKISPDEIKEIEASILD